MQGDLQCNAWTDKLKLEAHSRVVANLGQGRHPAGRLHLSRLETQRNPAPVSYCSDVRRRTHTSAGPSDSLESDKLPLGRKAEYGQLPPLFRQVGFLMLPSVNKTTTDCVRRQYLVSRTHQGPIDVLYQTVLGSCIWLYTYGPSTALCPFD